MTTAGSQDPNEGLLEHVCAGGSNAREALTWALGREPSEDLEADAKLAIRRITEWQREMPLMRALILHLLYSIYHPLNDDVWQRVTVAVGWKNKSTTYDRAHVWQLKDPE